MGNSTNPIQGITFDNVNVKWAGLVPYGLKYYHCENVIDGVASGSNVVPPCFHKGKGNGQDTTAVE